MPTPQSASFGEASTSVLLPVASKDLLVVVVLFKFAAQHLDHELLTLCQPDCVFKIAYFPSQCLLLARVGFLEYRSGESLRR